MNQIRYTYRMGRRLYSLIWKTLGPHSVHIILLCVLCTPDPTIVDT